MISSVASVRRAELHPARIQLDHRNPFHNHPMETA
jgi:hypothetical protein